MNAYSEECHVWHKSARGIPRLGNLILRILHKTFIPKLNLKKLKEIAYIRLPFQSQNGCQLG